MSTKEESVSKENQKQIEIETLCLLKLAAEKVRALASLIPQAQADQIEAFEESFRLISEAAYMPAQSARGHYDRLGRYLRNRRDAEEEWKGVIANLAE